MQNIFFSGVGLQTSVTRYALSANSQMSESWVQLTEVHKGEDVCVNQSKVIAASEVKETINTMQ